ISVASTAPGAVEIVLHETAHSFANLADEYGRTDVPCDLSLTSSPNLTSATALDHIKWKLWIAADTQLPSNNGLRSVPGLYEGGGFCDNGLYRPTYES